MVRRLIEAQVVDERGAPGPSADRWVDGGFARLRVDDPGRTTLYANRQGGFRVQCPVDGSNIADSFARQVTAWRSGGPRALTCPACGAAHALEEVAAQPPLAFADLAVVTADADAPTPTPWAMALATRSLGPVRLVRTRG